MERRERDFREMSFVYETINLINYGEDLSKKNNSRGYIKAKNKYICYEVERKVVKKVEIPKHIELREETEFSIDNKGSIRSGSINFKVKDTNKKFRISIAVDIDKVSYKNGWIEK